MIDDALEAICHEHKLACKHGELYHSTHEALGVLLEEFEEFKDEVKQKVPNYGKMYTEASQIGAVVIKTLKTIRILAHEAKFNGDQKDS